MNKVNFMSLEIGEKFRHIDFDDDRIFTKVTRGRYADQFGFEDFMMDALTRRWIMVDSNSNNANPTPCTN